jgi:four helix bundle protein
MFLQLAHTRLTVYQASRALALACYRVTQKLPPEEKFAMGSQLRRAALSVHLNVAEGSSRKSVAERKRYYEIARGSVIEIDAAIEVAFEIGYVKMDILQPLGDEIIKTFKLLSGMIKP